MVDQELLQALSTMIDQKIAPLREDVRTIVKEETAPLKEEIQEIKADVQTLKTDVQTLKTDVLELKATQEGVILPAIQRLAEGQANILEHIDEKITDRTEQLQIQVDALTIAVKYHSQDIMELKEAVKSA